MASKPMSEMCSTISRGDIRVRSKVTTHRDVVSETDTERIPGIALRPDSTVEVQEEQVMPYIRSVTASSRAAGMRVASNPMSDISLMKTSSAKTASSLYNVR